MAYILHFTLDGRPTIQPCRSLKDAVWEAWTLLENGDGDPEYVTDEQGEVVLDHEALLQQVSEKDER
jgi:hypothetical protein